MDNTQQQGQIRGGYRGRGGMLSRGNYEGRGRYNSFFPSRGRGLGRGLMRGGPPMMRGRGVPRGPMRGMGMPRGMGGMPRGPPPPSRGGGRPPGPPPQVPATEATTNGSQNGSRGIPRGRGGLPGRGRGGSGVGGAGSSSNHVPPPGTVGCLKSILPREDSNNGINPRSGRGDSYQSVTITRQLTGSSQPPPAGTTQQGTAVLPIKRGAPNGPPGSKRGRYDQGGQQNRQIPLHHGPINSIPQQHVPQHNSYSNSQAPVQSSHHSYQSHEQVQPSVVDSYSQQAYSTQSQGYMNNGYSQNTYGQQPVATQSSYAPVQEYDQHYDYRYSSGPYTQDTRYQSYNTQDYTHQQYSGTTDYNTTPQDTYATSSYDDRTYSGYDTQAYSQGYANQGYY